MTFAEMRKRMEEAMAKAKQDAAAAEPEPEAKKGEPQKEYEVDFAIAAGPGAKAVAGTDTKEQIATITVREKGKTIEEAMLITDQQVADALDGLPEEKLHCSNLAAEGIREAIQDYLARKKNDSSQK
jgi:hypothetical protein